MSLRRIHLTFFLLFFSLSTFASSLPAPRFHAGADFGIKGWEIGSVGSVTAVLPDSTPSFAVGYDLRLEAPVAKYFHLVGILAPHFRRTDVANFPSDNGFSITLNLGLKVPFPIEVDFGTVEPYLIIPIGTVLDASFNESNVVLTGLNMKPALGTQFMFGPKYGLFVEAGANVSVFHVGALVVSGESSPALSGEAIIIRPWVTAGFTLAL